MANTLTDISELIVHEVPQRFARSSGGAPILSDVPSPLNDDLKTYFLQKISGTLSAAAFPVVRDPTTTSPVPRLIAAMFAGDATLVAASQEMANHLYTCQTGVNSPGLLLAIRGTAGKGDAITLLKLEKEEGVRLQRQEVRGRLTFDIQHLRELMLTQSTKVFKVGLFPRHGTRPQDVKGDVSDNQRGFQPQSVVADFFLRQFLGCQLFETPNVTTRLFFEATEKFLNSKVDDPERKARYETSLIAEMGSQAGSVDPRAFARRYLDAEDRDSFIETVRESGLTAAQFVKDISQIANRVKHVMLSFDSGVRVTAPADQMGETVKVTTRNDSAVVTIQGSLDKVRGR